MALAIILLDVLYKYFPILETGGIIRFGSSSFTGLINIQIFLNHVIGINAINVIIAMLFTIQ